MDGNLSPYTSIYRTVPPHVMSGLGFIVTGTSQRTEPIFHYTPTWCNALERDIQPDESRGMKVIVTAETQEGVTCSGEFTSELAGDSHRHASAGRLDGDASNRIVFERHTTRWERWSA